MKRKLTIAAIGILAVVIAVSVIGPMLPKARIASECGPAPTPDCLLEAAVQETRGAGIHGYDYAGVMGEIGIVHARLGKRDAATEVFRKALEKGDIPSGEWRVAAAMAETGDFDGALEITRQIPDVAPRDNGFWSIAIEMARAGDPDGAAKIARLIEDPGERHGAQLEIAKIQLAAGADMDTVWPLLQESVKSGIRQTFSAHLTVSVVKVLARSGEIERAEWARGYMIMGPAVRLADIEIDVARAKAGNMAAALARVETTTEPEFRAIFLGRLSAVAAGAGNSEKADALFRRALEIAAVVPAEGTRNEAMAGLAYSREEAGHLTEALDLANRIGNPERRDDVLTGLLNTRIAAGNPDNLDGIPPMISDPVRRNAAWMGIARGRMDAGDMAAARRDLARARSMIEGSEMELQHDDGLVFELFRAVFEGNHAGRPRDEGLAALAPIWVRAIGLAEAMELASQIDNQYWRATALTNMARVLATDPN